MLIEQSYLFPPDVLYSFIRRVRYLYVYHGVYHISHTHNKHYWILVLLECSPRIHTCEYYSRHKRKKPPMSNIIFGRTPSQYCYWKTERGPWNNFRLLNKLYHCIWALTRDVDWKHLRNPRHIETRDSLRPPQLDLGGLCGLGRRRRGCPPKALLQHSHAHGKTVDHSLYWKQLSSRKMWNSFRFQSSCTFRVTLSLDFDGTEWNLRMEKCAARDAGSDLTEAVKVN